MITNSALSAEIWNSAEGLGRLSRSQFKNDFYQLVNFYQPQENPVYCAVASGTMVLNAINYGDILSQKNSEIVKSDGKVIEYHLYAQNGFLNEETDKIKSRKLIEAREAKGKVFENGEWHEIYDAGLSLGDLTKILSQVYKLKTEATYIKKNNEKSLQDLRETVKKILSDKQNFLIANFDGKLLEQKTNGHIAPVVAYDEDSDSVLILDPALHKNQWFWTALPKLLEAMNTMDDETYRGYIIVSGKVQEK